MVKRKSKTTGEFKPPKRTQPRAKRQRSTDETTQNQIQTPNSENNDSHSASCSETLDEHQPRQSILQICLTKVFPVDSCCSLEEKTGNDDNDGDGNGTNPPEVSHEIEQTAEITVQTPEPNDSDQHTSVKVTNEDEPDVELDDEKSEITSSTNTQSQKVPEEFDSELPSVECQTERELSHEDSVDTEPKMGEGLGSSDIIAETSVDETGVQMTEETDPSVKRKIRKRMGMCRLGERKRTLKEQQTRGNELGGGQENEAGQVINEEAVMMSDDLKKDGSISVEEEGTTESVSASSIPTPCPLEDIPVQEEQEQSDVQNGNDAQKLVECMSSEQEITHETDNTIPSCANSDDPLEKVEPECVEHGTNESNVREDKPEMCKTDITAEIGTEVAVDLAEVCKETTDGDVIDEGPLEVLKETAEALASTSEVANHFEELPVVGVNEMEVEECCPCESDMNTSISGHTKEQGVEITDNAANETVSALPVIDKIEDKCESLDCTLDAAATTAENTMTCEDSSMWSLPLPAAPPCGEDKDVQSVTEHVGLLSDAREPHLSPAAQPDPSSPSSIHSLTDSQLKNMALSLDDLPISEAACELEDATELVCSLIRDLAYLNQVVRDAHRKIGPVQQVRKPPRPQFRCNYGPPR